MTTRSRRGWFWYAALALSAVACQDKPKEHVAPTSSALTNAAISEEAVTLTLDSASSKVSFVMEAPIEKIYGEAPASLSGELFLDPVNLKKSTALLKVDLEKLSLFQQKRDDEKAEFGERSKNATQNEHARTWLEISPDAPTETREKNRYAELRIDWLDQLSVPKLSDLSGSERKFLATAVGELRLHGRSAQKRAALELVAVYQGPQLKELRVRTILPFNVGLEEYDVRPREAFGKLAEKTLEALGSKVTKTAPLQVEFIARPKK